MTIYDLKPRFQNLLRPFCRWLEGRGVTANQVTLAAFTASLAFGLWMALQPASRWPFLLLPVLLFSRMALNAIDGMLAREFGQKSRLGAILNELTDVLADAGLYLPFALLSDGAAIPIVLFVVLAGAAELTGVLGQTIGASRRYDGPFGKSDRAALFGALGFFIGLGLDPAPYVDFAGWAAIVLSVLTIFRRARAALTEGESA